MVEEGQEVAPEYKQIYRQGAEAVSAQKVEIFQGGCNSVDAQEVVVKQGGIGQAKASKVEVRQGGIGSVDGESVSVIQGGAGMVRTKEASLGPGANAGVLIADKVSAQQAGAQVMERFSSTWRRLKRGALVRLNHNLGLNCCSNGVWRIGHH